MTNLLARPTTVSSLYVCARCAARRPLQTHPRRFFGQSQRLRQHTNSLLASLEERGFINQLAGDRNVIDLLLRTKQVGVYVGVDPTAPSLHLGHLLPMMVLFWMYLHGHHVVSLIGGSTARVGDPSGRLTTRDKTTDGVHVNNTASMSKQMVALWDNVVLYAKRRGFQEDGMGKKQLLDNTGWLQDLNILDFLKTLGNGTRIGTMLGRDTVRNKMEKGDGMSFSEFTYPLLQGWDWWHMYKTHNIQMQIGGSDQYGNIIAGIDAIRHIAQNQEGEMVGRGNESGDDSSPMGITVPLLLTSTGEKFGKSAGNAVWFDRGLTSSFDLYGFLLRSSDSDVERYLRLFTFKRLDEIRSVMIEHTKDPGRRKAQHLLASEVLELVHGHEQAEETRAKHEAMRNPTLSSTVPKDERIVLPASLVTGSTISRILYHAGLVQSKSEGARLIRKGGVYVASAASASTEAERNRLDFVQVNDVASHVPVSDGVLLLRLGKWKVRAVESISDEEFDANQLDAPGWKEWKERSSVE